MFFFFLLGKKKLLIFEQISKIKLTNGTTTGTTQDLRPMFHEWEVKNKRCIDHKLMFYQFDLWRQDLHRRM